MKKERKMGALQERSSRCDFFSCTGTMGMKKGFILTRSVSLSSFQSELRVRHRDETKNVTRLTMENVRFYRHDYRFL